MSEWENNIGESDEWYTPPDVFESLSVTFDLDPCSPGEGHWVPARKVYTKSDDGLARHWDGFVFMNPPFGGRNGHVPWIKKFITHGNGIAILRAYTSSKWFHDHVYRMDCMLFPFGKTKFVQPNGEIGKQPGSGVVFFGIGETAFDALEKSNLGLFLDLRLVSNDKPYQEILF